VLSRPVADAAAERSGVSLAGDNGVIGTLVSVALTGLSHEGILDPGREILL